MAEVRIGENASTSEDLERRVIPWNHYLEADLDELLEAASGCWRGWLGVGKAVTTFQVQGGLPVTYDDMDDLMLIK